MHREAHGQIAKRLIEVQPELVEAFLGGSETSPSGAVVLPGGGGNERYPAIRTILFTDIVGSTNEALGDEAGMALLGVHDVIVRDALAATDGREVKTYRRRHHGVRPSCRPRRRFAAQPGFSAPWPSISRSTPDIRSRFGLAPRPGSPSSVNTISSERRCNWPHGCIPTPSPSKFWSRTWLCLGKGLPFKGRSVR